MHDAVLRWPRVELLYPVVDGHWSCAFAWQLTPRVLPLGPLKRDACAAVHLLLIDERCFDSAAHGLASLNPHGVFAPSQSPNALWPSARVKANGAPPRLAAVLGDELPIRQQKRCNKKLEG